MLHQRGAVKPPRSVARVCSGPRSLPAPRWPRRACCSEERCPRGLSWWMRLARKLPVGVDGCYWPMLAVKDTLAPEEMLEGLVMPWAAAACHSATASPAAFSGTGLECSTGACGPFLWPHIQRRQCTGQRGSIRDSRSRERFSGFAQQPGRRALAGLSS